MSTNEQLGRLIDPDALEVAFRISTAQYARLLDENGRLISAPVLVTMDGFGLELTTSAVISRDSAAVGEGQTGRLLFARMDKPGGMKPGDFVTVRIEEPELENVVRLPASALGSDGQVLTVDAEDRLDTLPVTLMRRQGDDILVRGEGLEGQTVVTDRSPLLGKGIKVRVLNADRSETAEAGGNDTAMLELSEDRRARLIAYVEADKTMPAEVKSSLLDQLTRAQVPERTVQRLERRIGG